MPVSRLSHVLVALAASVGALRLARSRNHAALERIAELERETSRLTEETRRAWRIKDDFLATLSHELRTPLNAMLGWVQLLRIHSDDVAMRNHAIDVVERNARTQVQIVADMLDVSRIITGQMRLALSRVDLPLVIRCGCEALAATAAAKNVELQIEIGALRGDVYGDATRLQQVVWNLVSNGIKFTPNEGRIEVRVRTGREFVDLEVADSGKGIAAEFLPYVFDRFRQADSSSTRAHGGLGIGLALVRHLVELHGGTVQDTGVGIAPEVLPFVFDRFRQADSSLTRPFGGLGLGLAIVRHLVELHGGAVQASSPGAGSGARFAVRLPLHLSPPRG